MSDQPDQQPEVPSPQFEPEKKKRKRSKYKVGRPKKGEIREPVLPPPASPEEAAKNIDQFVASTAKAIVAGKDLPKGDTRWIDKPVTSVTLAHIKHLFGDDLEKAREQFAYKLLGTATSLAQRIENEVEDLPHSTLAFTMSVCIDKASQLLTKHAASSAGAAVGTQINVFADGKIDREALMRQLLGQAKPGDKEPPEAAGPVVDV